MRSRRGEGEFMSAGHWGALCAYDKRLRESRGRTLDVWRTTRVREVTRSVRLRFTTSTRVATRVYESREWRRESTRVESGDESLRESRVATRVYESREFLRS